MITINSKELLHAASLAAAALPDRAIASIQECIRVTPSFVEGISYQHGIRIPLATATGDGDLCLPAKDLIGVLGMIEGDVTLNMSGITWDGGSLTLPVEKGSDYLEGDFEEGSIPVTAPLIEALAILRPYLNQDEMNAFSAAYIDYKNGYVYGGTTKSLRRQAISKDTFTGKIAITRQSIQMLQKWAKGDGWKMGVGASTLFFSRNDERFFITSPTFTAPKFEVPFERFEEPTISTFKKAPTPKAVAQVLKAMSNILGPTCLAHFIPATSGFEIVCASADSGKRMVQRLPGALPCEIHFNAGQLCAALDGASEWLLLDKKNAALIRGEGFECQVQPIWFND